MNKKNNYVHLLALVWQLRIGSVIQLDSHSIYLRRENLLPVQS